MTLNNDEKIYLLKKNKEKINISQLEMNHARILFHKAMDEGNVFCPIFNVFDKYVQHDSGKIRIRIYHPLELVNNNPIMIFCHGGGFIMGNIESYDSSCRNFSKFFNCIVVLIEYRLAPENKYPTAIDDCYRVVKWILRNPNKIGGNIEKLIIAGDSAGGHIAANVILRCIKRGLQIFKAQLLMYPVIDFYRKSKSHITFGNGYNVTSETLEWCYKNYFGNSINSVEPLLSMEKKIVEKIPTTIIITAEYDPLRDEGKQYHLFLRKHGVISFYKQFEGTIHGFMSMQKLFKTTTQYGFEFVSNRLSAIFS